MRRRERAAYEKGYRAGLEDGRQEAKPVRAEFTPHPFTPIIHIPQPDAVYPDEYADYDPWSD